MSDKEKVNFETKMLIDGALVEGEAGVFPVINPATEESLGVVSMLQLQTCTEPSMPHVGPSTTPIGRPATHSVSAASSNSKRRWKESGRSSGRSSSSKLAVREPRPNGPQLDAPLNNASKYPAKLIEEFPWEITLDDGVLSEVTGQVMAKRIWREPAGVVGAIVPWNFPFEVTINKVGQALATGNTVVLKPAPDTPFNATRLGRLIAERTDIPAGVINVVTASDHLAGEELTLSPKVDLISFTLDSDDPGRFIPH